MLQSLSMNNIMNEGSDLRDRIICEDVPSSQKWLPEIMAAMRDGKKLEMTYQSFWKTDILSLLTVWYRPMTSLVNFCPKETALKS